ncbi:ABC transporter permease [Treponema primitia]|uniref:ABC transporter permease n=1 Tax=Treponema primitia TaxID=88058 RepID=UPI00397F5359
MKNVNVSSKTALQKPTGAAHFLKYGVLAPLVIWLFLFLIFPYLNLLLYSLWKNGPFAVIHEFTIASYKKFFTPGSGTNAPGILLNTLRIALMVTVISVFISFPLAYFINFKVKRYKQTFYMLAIVPLWISYVMRAYSWRIILGTNGMLNSFLLWTGLINKPSSVFLFSDISVIIAMVHIYTPFVLMPMYSAMEQIPLNLIEASKDLGRGSLMTFLKIVFPLSLPGVITGATYAFSLSMGDYLAPSLLGGPTSSTKIANIVQLQFGTSNNWPYGAAIGVIILALVLVILFTTGRLEKHFSKLER